MFGFRKKSQQRRLEARKQLGAPVLSAWRRFRQAGGLGAALLAAVFFVCALVMDLWPLDPLPYRAGQYIAGDIYSRVSFEVPSAGLLESRKRKVSDTTPAVLKLDSVLVEEVANHIRNLPDRLKNTTQPSQIDDAVRKQFAIATEADLAAWRKYNDPDGRKLLESQVKRLTAELARTPIVPPQDRATQLDRGATSVVLAPAGTSCKIADLIAIDDSKHVAETLATMSRIFDDRVAENVRSYLQSMLGQGQPLYTFDGAATQAEIARELKKLDENPPMVFHKAGEVLVRASLRETAGQKELVGLSTAELGLLGDEHYRYLVAEHQKAPWLTWTRGFGRAGLLLVLTALLCLYIARNHGELVRNHWRAAALTGVLLAMLVVCKAFTAVVPSWSPYITLLPLLMAVIVVTIAFDQRFAWVVASIFAIIIVQQLRGELGMLMVMLAGSTAIIFQLREIRSPSKLIRVCAVAAGVVFVATLAAESATDTPWKFSRMDSAWGAGMTLLLGFLAQGALPVIERVFRVATSMTLLSWCDASKPLLRRLAMEAPGTYNHSLQLGSMCEAAADAIGARGLLARVGAYYHDIGKINKPPYFVENQTDGASKHAKLSPTMSLLIIIGHVKDGLELAREYGLPPVLNEFVASHHGTTLVQYFYHAASEQRRSEHERLPEEIEFRYPGPKPHSAEAAILMLADAAESSVRAMSEPTPGRIENQVHTIINRRLMDGQLDDCELMLREVHGIEASLVKSLTSMYHTRVSYPTPPGQKPSAGELLAARKTNGKTAEQE